MNHSNSLSGHSSMGVLPAHESIQSTKPTREERKVAKKAAKKALRKAEKEAEQLRQLQQAKTILSASTDSMDSHKGNYLVTTKEKYADRIIAIPELVQRQVHEQAYISVPRKAIEKEKLIHVKETVEIPEIEYIDEYVQEEVIEDVHRTVEKPVFVEKIVEHLVHVDDIDEVIVEVPEVTYDDVIVTKDVPVPTVVEKEIIVEKVVPTIKEELIEDITYLYQDREVRRNIPVPVEARVVPTFFAPRVLADHQESTYQCLLPEFTEHAVWSSCLTKEGAAMLPEIHSRLKQLPGSSLCEVEKLFCDIKAVDMESKDWLNASMLKSKMNLPYMGVESTNILSPIFIGADEVVNPLTKETVKATRFGGRTKSKNPCRVVKARSFAEEELNEMNGSMIFGTHQSTFIQVDSGHVPGQMTTLNPSVTYAKKKPDESRSAAAVAY